MSRRAQARRMTGFVAATVTLLAALVVLPSTPAFAVGPELTLTKSGNDKVLAGDSGEYSLSASNPAQPDAVPEYNVTFRDELPAGVTYQPGSTLPSSFGEPRILVDPVDGHQTLIWDNVADLPVGASKTLDFKIDIDSDAHPVGSTFTNTGNVYANSSPRTVATFDDNGDPSGGYTESVASLPVTTSITALKINKTEPSPEQELLRGVHDHSTIYTLTVRNSGTGSTSGVTVVDYLPAGLEFLGCGDVDNGTGPEYAGAPNLDAIPDVTADCPTPVRVETVTDPPGKAAGVYTRVEWDLGTLGPGAVVPIKYAAGIPQRANTMAFPGGPPEPAGLGQVANLDNNTGVSTRELTAEDSYRNYAEASGGYQGEVVPGTDRAVSDADARVVSAEDVALQKSVSPTSFKGGGIATYTLRVSLSEYADASDIVLTDHLPDGLCPLSTTENYAASDPENECGPGAGFGTSGADFASVVANDDGSFDLTFTPVASVRNGVLTVTYQARMRRVFGSDGQPTVSGDGFTNTVELTGTSVPASGITTPDSGPVAIVDASSAGLNSDVAQLDKTIQPDVTPYACSEAPSSYIEPADQPTADLTFAEGSRVCFRIRLDFSDANSTRNPTLVDFLPAYLSYEDGSAVVAAGSEPATLAATEPLRWEIGTTLPPGTALYSPAGSYFDVRFSAIVTKAAPPPEPDVAGNLAKFSWQNTDNQAFGLRDKLELGIAPAPPVTLEKGAVRVSAPGSSLADGASVVADEVLEYSLVLGNDGTAANENDEPIVGPDVWDVLPAGVSCADVSIASISDGGVCTDPDAAGHPDFVLRDSRSAIRWNLPDSVSIDSGDTKRLTYRLTVPTGSSVSTSYTNTASVASFATISNIETIAQHHPDDNVDTTVSDDQIDAPAAADSFTVVTPSAELVKSNLTAIDEAGNGEQDAVVGEVVTYTISATIPAHTSVYEAALSDPIPSGLTFVSAAGALSTDDGAAFDPLPTGFVLNADDGTLTFPATYANSSDVDHIVRVTIVARVENVPANSHGTELVNTASFGSRSAIGGADLTPVTASSTVTVATPGPSLAKTDDDADNVVVIGDVVTFTLTAANAAGRPPAHDMFVVDCVPSDLDVTGIVTGSPDQGTVTRGASTGSDGCTAGDTRIEWKLGTLASGASRTLSYTTTMGSTASGGLSITNRATQTSSTLNDGKAAPADADNDHEQVFVRTATDTLSVRGPAVIKSVDEPTHTVGERATYTVRVTLPGGVNFPDATIVDTLPAGLDVSTLVTTSVSCQRADASSCTVDGSPLTSSGTTIGWFLGDLVSDRQVRTVTLVYSAVVADVPGNVAGAPRTNGAAIRSNLEDGPDPTSVAAIWDFTSTPPATATFTVTEPSLSIAKSVSNATPEPGQQITYTVAVTNATGAAVSTAHQVTVVDAVPVGVVVDATSISNGGTLAGASPSGGGTITWVLTGPIAPSVIRSLTYDARLASPTLTGDLTNTADITRYTSTATGGRVYDGPSDTATVTAALPHVSVDKAVQGGDLAYLGEPKPWRVTVTSDGDATAYGVDVTDVLPPSWTYDAGSARVVVDGGPATPIAPTTSLVGAVQTLVWTDLADLPVGDAIVVTFTATPRAGAATDPGVGHSVDHVNLASTTAEDADGNQGPAGGGSYHGPPDTAVAHLDSADLTVEKTHTEAPVAGAPFAWTVTVSNAGPDAAVGPFTVTDTLPAGVTGGVASGAGWSCSTSGAQITCTRTLASDTLASDSSFPDITVAVDVPADLAAGTLLTNAVAVTGKSHDPDPTNNSDSDDATVEALADLAMAKRLVGALVAGAPATYTLDVTNLGPSVSRGSITVTDTLPAGSSLVSATGTGWTCSGVAPVSCTRTGQVALGALPQITITVNIPADQVAPVTNRATVQGPLDDNPDNDTDSVTTDPATSADLALEKASVGDFTAGDQGTYRFTVTNNGPSDAQSPVRVVDTLPAMLTYAGYTSVTGSWSCLAAGQVVTCTLTGALADGENAAVEIDVDIDTAHTGPITNTATVSSSTSDPNGANSTDDDDTAVNTRADLSVVKSHTGPVVAGEQVSYALAVRNNGPSLSPTTVTVTDTLPNGMTYVGSSGPAWTCTADGRVVTCELSGPLSSRTNAPPLSILADVGADAGPARLVNAASVDGPLTDPDLRNNAATDPTDVIDRANLSLAKTVSGSTLVTAGDRATFEIAVHNDGPSVADSVFVTDPLPSGLILVSASGAGWDCLNVEPLTCSRDTLDADTDAPVITVVATVGAGVADGTRILNSASVTTATAGDDPVDNTGEAALEVRALADLALTKSHPASDVVAGTATTFTIIVRNRGLSDAVGPLVVTDTLPAGMSFLSATGGWDCVDGGAEVTCTYDDGLMAGQSAPPLGLVVQVDAGVDPQDLMNVAEVSSATLDPVSDNNTGDATVSIVANAGLSLTKSHVGTGLVGEELAFTLQVSNAGPSEANAVTLTDTLPAGLDFVSAEGPGWTCAISGPEITCDLADPLAPDSDAGAIVVTVLVRAAAYPAVVNLAAVTSDAMDPNPDDNLAEDALEVAPLVNLMIDKRHEGDFKVGEEGSFTLAVANQGPTLAPGPITVTDILPGGLTLVSAGGDGWSCAESDGTLSCERGELAVDEVSMIDLVVRVGPTAYPSVTNAATIESDSAETDLTDNADEDPVTVIPLVELSLTKELVRVSSTEAVFDLTVTNDGPNDSVGAIVVTDVLPAGLAYVSDSGAGWTCSQAGRKVTCTYEESLPAGERSTVRLVTAVTAGPGSEITNEASAAGGGSDVAAQDDALVQIPPSDVAGTGSGLPNTGGPWVWLLPLGGLLLLCGAALISAGAWRRRETS